MKSNGVNLIKQALLILLIGLSLNVCALEGAMALRSAGIFVAAGQFKQAVSILKEYDSENSEEEISINLLTGKIYLALDKPAKALDFFELVDSQSIDNYEAVIGIAHSNLKLGKFKQAERYVQIAKKINSDAVEPDFISAVIGLRSGLPGQSGDRLLQLTKTRPESEDALIAYAKFLALSGDLDGAKQKLNYFLSKAPNSPGVQDHMAEMQYQSGNKTEAIRLKTLAADAYEKQKNFFKRDTILAWLNANALSPVQPKTPEKPQPPATIKLPAVPQRESAEVIAESSRAGPSPKGDSNAISEIPRKVSISRKEVKPKTANLADNEFVPPIERFPFPSNVSITGGSGFIIDFGKKVVTNKHVIEDGKEFAIRTGLGEIIKARVMFISPSDDIAILELDRPLPPDRAIPSSAYSKPRVGRNVVVMGYPLWYMLGEGSPSLTNGMVSKRTGLKDDLGTFQLTAKVNKGNSGGPVFDLFGNVVGITVGKLDNKKIQMEEGFIPEDINFAIHVDRLPSVANVEITTGDANGPELSSEELYQTMLGKVVMVATYK